MTLNKTVPPLPSAHCAMLTFLLVVVESTRSSGIVRAPSISAILKESVHSLSLFYKMLVLGMKSGNDKKNCQRSSLKNIFKKRKW